jgi:roadblock/LC7 domain-containing protein
MFMARSSNHFISSNRMLLYILSKCMPFVQHTEFMHQCAYRTTKVQYIVSICAEYGILDFKIRHIEFFEIHH